MSPDPVASNAAPGASTRSGRRRADTESFSAGLAVSLLAMTVLTGWYFSRSGFINPESGLGYWLGIAGTCMMGLLLIYPLRKRVRALRILGRIPHWFRAHMVLGVVGPTLVILHTNFKLGSPNSRVALYCMLVVATSGLVGRFLYRQVHHGLYGRRASLGELRAQAQQMRTESGSAQTLFDGVNEALCAYELNLEQPSSAPLGHLTRPFAVAVTSRLMQRRLLREVHAELAQREAHSQLHAGQRPRLARVARRYLKQRLGLSRRIAMFRLYERLLALWHVLHIPIFVLMVLAVVVHIYAVHAY